MAMVGRFSESFYHLAALNVAEKNTEPEKTNEQNITQCQNIVATALRKSTCLINFALTDQIPGRMSVSNFTALRQM